MIHVFHQRPCWYPWSVLLPEVLLIYTGHAAAGKLDMSGLCCYLRPCWCPELYSCWELRWYPRLVLQQRAIWVSVLPPEIMLRSLTHADIRPSQCPCVSPWSMFPLTVKGKKATFAVVMMTADSQLRKRDLYIFCDNLYPPTPPYSPKE